MTENKNNIKNLLFDLGGVIMDIKRERCVEAFTELGMKDADSFFGVYSQQGPFLDLEEGKIRVDEFHAILRRLLPPGVTDAQMDAAFCRFLTGIPVHRLRELEKLKKDGYGVYMLSNTNPIMWDSVIRNEFLKDGHDREYYFDGIITSFSAGCQKPDLRIFRLAASQLGLTPYETLFLDDSVKNLDAAAEVGYLTAAVPPGTEFTDVLARHGISI